MDNKPYKRDHSETSESASQEVPGPQTENVEPQRPEKLWSGPEVFLIAGTCVFTFLGGLFLTTSLMAQKTPNNPDQALNTVNFTITYFIVEFIVLVGCVYFLGLRRKQASWESLGLYPLALMGLLGAIGIGLLEFVVENIATYGLQFLFQVSNDSSTQVMTQGLSWFNLMILLAIGGLAIPFAEEIFFRGVLYNYFKGRWGMWAATFASALIYAVVTLDPLNGVAAFIMSLFAIWAYERTRSLWGAVIVSIISHMGSLVIFYTLSTSLQHVPIF